MMNNGPPQCIAVILLAALSGCIEGRKLEPDGSADQSTDFEVTSPDQGARDSAQDALRVDLALPKDLGPPPPDGAPAPDAMVHQDSSLPPNACVDSTVDVKASNMVICTTSDEQKTQCNAEDLCNLQTGWHLCTASEYLARGGATAGVPAEQIAWLAGCVSGNYRELITTPTDEVCGSCDSSAHTSVFFGWPCSGTGVKVASAGGPLGVVTSAGCLKLGPSDASAVAGFWNASITDIPYGGAVCCK